MKCESCGRGIPLAERLALSDEGDPTEGIKTWDRCIVCSDGNFAVTLKHPMKFISLECTIGVGKIEP